MPNAHGAAMDKATYKAWLDECQEMWDGIVLNWAADIKPGESGARKITTDLNDFMYAIFQKAMRPYYWFHQEYSERKMLEESGKGGTGVESGVGPTGGPSQRGIEGTKPQTVLDRGTHPKATEGESGSSPEPARPPPQSTTPSKEMILVRVEGKTYESRYDLRVGFGLIFQDKGRFYEGKIPPEQMESLTKYVKERGGLMLMKWNGKSFERVDAK